VGIKYHPATPEKNLAQESLARSLFLQSKLFEQSNNCPLGQLKVCFSKDVAKNFYGMKNNHQKS